MECNKSLIQSINIRRVNSVLTRSVGYQNRILFPTGERIFWPVNICADDIDPIFSILGCGRQWDVNICFHDERP